MDNFTIKGHTGFLKVTIDEVFGFPETTCYWGGYDTRTILEIESDSFYVKTTLYITTGEFHEFYNQLKDCNTKLQGTATLKSYEGNLSLIATYNTLGHVDIRGSFSKQNEFDNKLDFQFPTDQSFIKYTIEALELIANKYGGQDGVKI